MSYNANATLSNPTVTLAIRSKNRRHEVAMSIRFDITLRIEWDRICECETATQIDSNMIQDRGTFLTWYKIGLLLVVYSLI